MRLVHFLMPWKQTSPELDAEKVDNRRVSRRSTGLQLSLLAGLALALVGTVKQPAVAKTNSCLFGDDCTFKKPNFLIVLDYSTAMNTEYADNLTRWEAAVGAIESLVLTDAGFLDYNTHFALMRFGHDPDPNVPGTLIPGDASGIVDGQKLDVHWYDPGSENKYYEGCTGENIVSALVDNIPPPLDGNPTGIGTWTKGALDYAHTLIGQSYIVHPDDLPSAGNRYYGIFVLTHGDWTNPDGVGQSPENNPATTASELLAGTDLPENPPVPTFAVFYGDEGGSGEASTEELAIAGGTTTFTPGTDFQVFYEATSQLVTELKEAELLAGCILQFPRIMVILDASSAMLNIGGGTMAAPKGQSGWDQARLTLAGDESIFDVEINLGSHQVVEDFVHLGLLVFGDNTPAPGEQKVLVNYGPCMKDNFRWALAPEISHPDCPAPDYTQLLETNDYVIPDCEDPWNGPSINWAFETISGGLPDPNSDPQGPGFDLDTQTHMPRCEGPGPACAGSGTYIHLGLDLAANNQAQFHADQEPLGLVGDETPYFNILVTNGRYDGYSTDTQVQAALETMYQNGIPTYVIGLGDGVETPTAVMNLHNMAKWGSDGNENYFEADNQQQVEAALVSIIEQIAFDPCCGYDDCSMTNEPTTGEEDFLGDCTFDSDCPENHVCEIFGGEMLGWCTFEGCLKDDDCGSGEICNDDHDCEFHCSDDSQCEGNLVCNEQTGECQPGVCPDDYECQQGEVCKDGSCVQGCSETPCIADESCVEGVCVPDEENPSTSTGEPDPATTDNDETTVEPSAGPTSATEGTEGASTTGETIGEGCSCSAVEDVPRGATGTLLALGLAGFIRRRPPRPSQSVG